MPKRLARIKLLPACTRAFAIESACDVIFDCTFPTSSLITDQAYLSSIPLAFPPRGVVDFSAAPRRGISRLLSHSDVTRAARRVNRSRLLT